MAIIIEQTEYRIHRDRNSPHCISRRLTSSWFCTRYLSSVTDEYSNTYGLLSKCWAYSAKYVQRLIQIRHTHYGWSSQRISDSEKRKCLIIDRVNRRTIHKTATQLIYRITGISSKTPPAPNDSVTTVNCA